MIALGDGTFNIFERSVAGALAVHRIFYFAVFHFN